LFSSFGFNSADFNNLAVRTKFKTRFNKLQGFDYLFALLSCCSNVLVSFNNLAAFLDTSNIASISKQALQKAMVKNGFLFFIIIIFKKILAKKLREDASPILFNNSLFKRVLIQDSTIIKLPKRLYPFFSGVSNGVGKTTNARVQYAFDIFNEEVKYFSIDSYSKNDLSQSQKLDIKNGDLVLRDRGYLSYAEIARLKSKGADFIYRYKFNIKCLNIETNKPLDILKLLKKHHKLDITVRLQDKNGPIVRIVSESINQEVANNRRAKLKKESSNKRPTKENLEMQSWSIYITSIPKEKMSYQNIFNIYKLRWRVEILFKAMKSSLNLDRIHNVSKIQLQIIIYAKIIFFVLTLQFIYLPASYKLKKQLNKELSLLKLIAYITADKMRAIEIIEELLKEEELIGPKLKSLAKYCSYEPRKRNNYHKCVEEIILS